MEPRHFKGLCWVFSLSGASLGAQTTDAAIVFAAEASLLSISPTSLNAIGFCSGAGLSTSLGGVGADAVIFGLRLE